MAENGGSRHQFNSITVGNIGGAVRALTFLKATIVYRKRATLLIQPSIGHQYPSLIQIITCGQLHGDSYQLEGAFLLGCPFSYM